MKTTTKALRRSLYAAFAASAVGGPAVVALAVPSATAATDPCAASEVAWTIGSVATSTGTYLDSHPETNQALTNISQQQGGPQSLGALKTYFDANPQVGKDMQQLQQPLVNLVLSDAHSVASEAAELQFQTFSRLVNRKARKSAPFLLSY
jgi:heme-binding protein